MTLLLKFSVPGQPVAKKRHQTATLKKCIRCQRQTMRRQCICGSYEFQFVTNIESTPRETVLYENLVAMAARDRMTVVMAGTASPDVPPLGGFPLSLTLRFYFPIPESRKKKLVEGQPHSQKPDLDNCIKSVLDGCNTVVFADDSLISEITASKMWTAIGGRTEIEVYSK